MELTTSWQMLQCDFSERATWEQRIAIFFDQHWGLDNSENPAKSEELQNLSGNFAICWLVSLDPKICAFFNGFGLVVAKWVAMLQFLNEIYDCDNSLSRIEYLIVYIKQ